jgi:predicted DCC family thiol-disulfide oxidoreductase YuxK
MPAAPHIPAATDRLQILLDADCALCTRLGQYLMRHARSGRFDLAPIRSDLGQRLVAHYAIPYPKGSFILIDSGHAYTKTSAVFRVARHLPAPARWVLILKIFPRSWTDALYDLIARNRHRIFKGPVMCARLERR